MESQLSLALQIMDKLQAAGHLAYLVGGCVRDRLLGVDPKDYDVGTSATPPEVQQLFPDAQLVGAHFGVMLVKQSPSVQVEVATFRSEGGYSDGRRPDVVRFERDPESDARRRDFTINGLFEDTRAGRVLDFVGGQQDLARKIIRAIGNPRRRFQEDHLRLLRAVRFAARFAFEIEQDTRRAIKELAPLVHSVSAERVRDELVRILTEGGARRGFELLDETGLLQEVLPEVKAMQGVAQPPEYHPEGDVWRHTLLMLDSLEPGCSPALAWGVLLHDVGKPPTFRVADRIRFDGHAEAGAEITERILSRLKVPIEQMEQARALVANHMRFKDVRDMRVSTLKRFLRLPQFGQHLELHRLDCLASNGYTDAYDFVRKQLETMDEVDLRPPRLLTGRDLIEAGHKPGPRFREALDEVESAQLEGRLQTREQALQVAETVLSRTSEPGQQAN